MTTVDGFYDSTTGDRIYNSQNFSDYIAMQRSNGYLLGFGDDLVVTQSGTPAMTVDVSIGGAFVQGRFIEVTAAETLNIAAADVTNPRIDRIVVRADESAGVRETLVDVLTGTPAGSPTAPALTQTSTIWEISLAQIAVAANETTITNAEITDERNDISLCGVSSIFGGHRGIGARLRRTTNQSITGSSSAAIQFDSEVFDTFDFFDSGANTRLTIQHDGIYMLDANVIFASDGNMQIRKNGTTIVGQTSFAGVNRAYHTSTIIEADKDDYFELVVGNGGATADVTTQAENSICFSIGLIGFTY